MGFIVGFFILSIIVSAVNGSNKKRNNKKFTKILVKHINTLSRKKDLYTTKDDYGFINSKAWELEKVNFLNKLIFHKEIGKIDEKSRKIYLKLIDSAISEYLKNNKVTFSDYQPSDPLEYERYCAYLLNTNGWNASVTKASGDHGVDIIAGKNGKYIAIQCKLYSTKVNNKAVQEVSSGKKHWKANIAVVVSNSMYTKHAIEIAKTHNVYLLNTKDLTNLDSIISHPPIYHDLF